MGLSRRKKSGKKIGGSSLIVVGQDIYSTKTFKPDFNNLVTQDYFNLVWC